jgi:hypothetical protein
MKVFKFYSLDLYYAYSGENWQQARAALFSDYGEMPIKRIEEIPETQWNDKFINMWEDNDFNNEPEKLSINDLMTGNLPELIFTNDLDSFQ